MTYHFARLDAVCEINPRMPKTISDEETVSFLPMAAVSEDGKVDFEQARTAREVKKGFTYFERGDVLVAKITPCFENGKAARTNSLENPVGFGSTEFHVLRAGSKIDPSYLFHLIWNSKFRAEGASNMTGSAGQKRVPVDFLKRLQIPLPPLDEQRRIAAILDKADDLRRKRKRALELLDSLTQSIFLEMFGDPVSNPKRLLVAALGDHASITSGGTPSKGISAYWRGNIPWVSPKDMKVVDVFDAEDHVSDAVLTNTALKLIEPMTVLMVVRGMILAHTAPIAITRRAVTINQDLKALAFSRDIHPIFALWCLKAQHDYILSKVDTAAHGTKRLETSRIQNLPLLVPDLTMQADFVAQAVRVSYAIVAERQASKSAGNLFSSLQHRAFSGQL